MIQSERMPISIHLLLYSTFLMNVGQFMVLPFLTIYLTTILHYTPWQVGTVLTVNLLFARILPVVSGVLGDRISHSTNAVAGVAIRGIGFIGYAAFHTFVPLVFASVLTGIGTALYTPSTKAIITTQPEVWRTRAFTRYNQSLNLGAVLGPLLGSLLIGAGIVVPFFLGGGLLLCIAGILFAFRRQYSTKRSESKALDSFIHALRHRTFIFFTLVMILFWIIFTQLTISFPIQAFRISNNNANAGTLFIVNGIAGVLLMFGLGKVFHRYQPIKIVSFGIFCTGLGFGLVPLFPSIIWLLFCVVVYTLGETLVLPSSDIEIAHLSPREHSGAFFGMSSLSWAIGGTVGNYLGPWLMGQSNTALPWMIYGGIGVVACLLMLLVGTTV